jgi:hypothetical protein
MIRGGHKKEKEKKTRHKEGGGALLLVYSFLFLPLSLLLYVIPNTLDTFLYSKYIYVNLNIEMSSVSS